VAAAAAPGNARVARQLRAAATAGPRHGGSALDDAGFRATVARLDAAAVSARRHGPAHSAATAAQAAAPGPDREVQAGGAARQVARIAEPPPNPFDRKRFEEDLFKAVDARAPKDLDAAEDLKSSRRLAELPGITQASTTQANADLHGQATAKPDESGIKAKPVTPLPGHGTFASPADLDAAQAAPKPLPDAAVAGEASLSQQRLDDQYAQAGLTDQQLAEANEPAFGRALADKQAAHQATAAVSGQYRATEGTVLAGARAEATAATGQQVAALGGTRGALLAAVTGRQHGTMTADQAARAKVAADLEQIYAKTRQAVEGRLAQLEKDATAGFDQAAAVATQAFEDYVTAALDERDGIGTRIGDFFTRGVPAEVQEIYDKARNKFIKAMKDAIARVSGIVADGLNDAKRMAADGRKEVGDAVAKLPAALRGVGREAAQSIGAKFDQLDDGINEKRDQLVDVLATRYSAAVKKLDDRITQLQEEQKGWLSRAWDAAKDVIKTLGEMKDLLFQVLAKVVEVIGDIIAHPIRFLGHLLDAVGQGVQNFAANIKTHLEEGFFQWLFGEIAKAGITLPTTWDLKGIFDLVMQVLGLTWPAVRKIAVEVVGEPVVQTLEKYAEPIVAFFREGPAGVWNWIKEQLGDLKAMVVDQIQSWLITRVIRKGIEWILSLFTPASAFIAACKVIYTVLKFIWTHGQQILEFVNSVLDSIADIAAGSIGPAAKKIEESLAQAIPLTIGFLADLLSLGDLAETIKGIIEKIQEPVRAAVKWLITKSVALVKAAGKLLGFGLHDKERGEHSDNPGKEAKIAEALAELDKRDAAAENAGTADRGQAEAIAAATRAEHPILTSITVVETPERFDYLWTASAPKKKIGLKRKYNRLGSARRIARKNAIKEARESLQSGFPTPQAAHLEKMLEDDYGRDAVERFKDTGKLPKRAKIEFSHLFSAAEYPEWAHRHDLGVLTTSREHRDYHHEGDTRVPLHGFPRGYKFDRNNDPDDGD
jgi:hypothetical protein